MKFKKVIGIILILTILFCGLNISVTAETGLISASALEIQPYKQIKYVKSKGLISGISPETDVSDVLKCFKKNSDISVLDNNNQKVDKGNVGTGWNFIENNSGESASALVYGDLNGDGKINLFDILNMYLHCSKAESLDSYQLQSMDINRDGEQNLKDCLLMRYYLVNSYNIRNSSFYYVSKSGNDSNDGSIDKPFLTIQKAADVMNSGDTCFIREGVYRETVIPVNEGEDGAEITFMPYENENVTISGTEVINSEWEEYKNGIYKTNFNIWRRTENQIFVNGEMAQIARYPNKQDNNPISVGDVLSADSASKDFLTDSNLTEPNDYFKGSRIFIEGTSHYIYYSSTVNNSSGGKVSFSEVAGGWDSPCENSNYYFYDSLNLLDSENEWYYDYNGTLYYKPPKDESPDKLNFEYSVRPDAFDIRDKSYITIRGLEIFGANIKTNAGSDNLLLDSDKILYYYHTMQSRYYPWEAEWYGVELWGKNSTVVNCEIAFSAEGGVEIYADNCSVVNNYIHDINYINSNAAAIEPKYCKNTLISHNTIDNIARSAILLACTDMRVSYNKISNCAVNTYDVTGIGSYKLDAKNTVEVDHNVIFNCNNGHDFVAYYLDNGSLNFLVHHNVCYNVDLAMILNNPSYGNKIYNNTFLSDKPICTGNMQNPFDNNSFIGAVWNDDQFYNNILPNLYYGTGAYYSNNLLSTNALVKLNPDCTLQSGSIAIDKGIQLPLMQEYEGQTVDIGAYEFGGEKWVSGVNDLQNSLEFSLSDLNSDFLKISNKPFLELENINGTNLVSDSGFENSANEWGLINASAVKENASSGDYSIKIVDGWIEKTVDVHPGQMYAYTGDIMVEKFGVTCEFGVHFMDNNYNIQRQGAFMVTANSYNTFETVFTVPEGCSKMRIFVACWGSDSVVYSDNLQCTLIN